MRHRTRQSKSVGTLVRLLSGAYWLTEQKSNEELDKWKHRCLGLRRNAETMTRGLVPALGGSDAALVRGRSPICITSGHGRHDHTPGTAEPFHATAVTGHRRRPFPSAPSRTEAHHKRPEGGAVLAEQHAGLSPGSRHAVAAAAAEQDGHGGALGGRDEQGRWWLDKRGLAIRVRELPNLATALDLAAEHQAPRPPSPGPGPRRDRPAPPTLPPPARAGGGEFSEFSAS